MLEDVASHKVKKYMEIGIRNKCKKRSSLVEMYKRQIYIYKIQMYIIIYTNISVMHHIFSNASVIKNS